MKPCLKTKHQQQQQKSSSFCFMWQCGVSYHGIWRRRPNRFRSITWVSPQEKSFLPFKNQQENGKFKKKKKGALWHLGQWTRTHRHKHQHRHVTKEVFWYFNFNLLTILFFLPTEYPNKYNFDLWIHIDPYHGIQILSSMILVLCIKSTKVYFPQMFSLSTFKGCILESSKVRPFSPNYYFFFNYC